MTFKKREAQFIFLSCSSSKCEVVYLCMTVCVCLWERERKPGRHRDRSRDTERVRVKFGSDEFWHSSKVIDHMLYGVQAISKRKDKYSSKWHKCKLSKQQVHPEERLPSKNWTKEWDKVRRCDWYFILRFIMHKRMR
jgi:hypothetical protein